MSADLRRDLVQRLRELQVGRCGICAGLIDLGMLDHDHDTGYIRGFLCSACNVQEGFHPYACTVDPCAICMWRRHPAASVFGFTVSYDGTSAWTDLGPYAPAAELIKRRSVGEQKIADAIESALKAPIDAALDEMGRTSQRGAA